MSEVITFILNKAIKDQSAEIERLKTELKELKQCSAIDDLDCVEGVNCGLMQNRCLRHQNAFKLLQAKNTRLKEALELHMNICNDCRRYYTPEEALCDEDCLKAHKLTKQVLEDK